MQRNSKRNKLFIAGGTDRRNYIFYRCFIIFPKFKAYVDATLSLSLTHFRPAETQHAERKLRSCKLYIAPW